MARKLSQVIKDVIALSSAPSAPAAGASVVYPKTDGFWYYKNSDNVEQQFAPIASPAFTGNPSAPNIDFGYSTTATTGGQTTLVAGSNFQQFFTGTSDHTVKLPVASTLVLGRAFMIINNSSGDVTVNSSGSDEIMIMPGNSKLIVTCILTSGTSMASWDAKYIPGNIDVQLASKAPLASPTFTGTVVIPTPFTLGAVSVLPTGTELNFVDGVTSAIQTQLDAKAPLNNYALETYSLLGGVIKAEPLTGNIMNVTTSAAMLEGQVHFIAVYLPKAATITGAKWLQNIAGAYTSNDYNGIGVYSISAGTLTLVASSTDDGNIWKATANTIGSKAFSATAALAAGVYFIGFIISYSAQSTLPRLGCYVATTNLIQQQLDFANSVKLNSYITAQTALPSSQAMSGTSLITAQFYVALY